jgi:ComF family protein
MALINDFLSLIYPRSCEACGANMFGHESYLCNFCIVNLPYSRYHANADNELARTFTGRVPLEYACAFYTYEKKGRIQKLLHAIKYQDQKELGEYLGILYAEQLKHDNALTDIDFIVPVPLHRKKLKLRGYNQSEWFARGLAVGLAKQLDTAVLVRNKETSTQTKKKKYERWENVEGIFSLTDHSLFAGKHVLLVDDVVTTGATIEAAWLALSEVKDLKLSVASIAFAARNA